MAEKRDPSLDAMEFESTGEKAQQLHSLQQAQQASDDEHVTDLKEALKVNYKACLWSAMISLTIVMEGYDMNLMQNFYGYPTFQRQFGTYYPDLDEYQLTGAWQAGLVNGTNVGVIIGGFINGWAAAKFGYRKTLQTALALQTGFIFISFFAQSVEMLLVGQMLCGLTWGVYATTGPAYASEVCPLALRGYLTIYVNCCWAMGQFISSGIIQGLVSMESMWGWRIPIAIQWIWPLPIFIGIIFAPESPWWLARNERYAEAERALTKLSTRSTEQCRASLSQIMHTIQLESDIQADTGYLECFRGVNLRRTEIVVLTFIGQQLAGSNFAYSPAYFLQQAGASVAISFNVGLGGTAIAFAGTLCSWILLSYFGRRSVYFVGMLGCCAVLLVVGITSAAAPDSTAALWVQVTFMLLWQAVYSTTVGPMCYAITSETSAIRLRPQSVVLARNSYNLVYIIAMTINPYMINPTEWNLEGKTGFVWAATAGMMATWAYFRLPETKHRSYEELDLLFAKKISARKFAKTKVDAYAEGNEVS